MDEFSKILTDKWKTIIESIVVNGYSRKVESVDCFRMDKYYHGYPQIEFCYKVNFNFEDGISSGQTHSNPNRYEWHKELESTFTKMFRDSNDDLPMPDSDEIKKKHFIGKMFVLLDSSKLVIRTINSFQS